MELESFPIRLSDGTYIYAVVENYYDPKNPHIYVAPITRETSTGSGIRSEKIRQQTFDDLIEALLYLESVDLGEYENTNDTEI